MRQDQRMKCDCGVVMDTSNAQGSTVFCVSCGDVVMDVKQVTQECVDRLRCRPFADKLAKFIVGEGVG